MRTRYSHGPTHSGSRRFSADTPRRLAVGVDADQAAFDDGGKHEELQHLAEGVGVETGQDQVLARVPNSTSTVLHKFTPPPIASSGEDQAGTPTVSAKFIPF